MRRTALLAVAAAAALCAAPHAAALDPLERVLVGSHRLVNVFGEPVPERVNVNQQVQVEVGVANGQDVPQPFVYILQVRGAGGTVVHVNTISGEMSPIQSLKMGQSWRPAEPGPYSAEIFIWSGLGDADPLTAPLSLAITVS